MVAVGSVFLLKQWRIAKPFATLPLPRITRPSPMPKPHPSQSPLVLICEVEVCCFVAGAAGPLVIGAAHD